MATSLSFSSPLLLLLLLLSFTSCVLAAPLPPANASNTSNATGDDNSSSADPLADPVQLGPPPVMLVGLTPQYTNATKWPTIEAYVLR